MTTRRIITAALFLALTACSWATPRVEESLPNPVSSMPIGGVSALTSGDAQAKLDAALAQWNTADIGSYALVYIWHCECDPGWAGPWRVTVSDSRITSFTHDQGVEPSNQPQQLTVEDLFEKAQAAVTNFPGNHSIEYDPEFALPRSISSDLEAIPVDGGETLLVSEFTSSN